VATCLYAPFHRFEDGDDLSRIPLAAVAGIPGVIADAAARPGALALELDRETVRDRAVIRTGWDERWGTAGYWEPGPYIQAELLDLLVGGGAALVGVDFWNVDDTATWHCRLGRGFCEPVFSWSCTSATSADFRGTASASSPSRSASRVVLHFRSGCSRSSPRQTAVPGRSDGGEGAT
jgi:kynurenine formamidase